MKERTLILEERAFSSFFVLFFRKKKVAKFVGDGSILLENP